MHNQIDRLTASVGATRPRAGRVPTLFIRHPNAWANIEHGFEPEFTGEWKLTVGTVPKTVPIERSPSIEGSLSSSVSYS
jgi:hypothetical protein